MKLSVKKSILISAASIMVTLTAYAGENNFTGIPKNQVIKFLEKASNYATKKMNYSSQNPQKTYVLCMSDPTFIKDTTFCPRFFDFMEEYAKKRNKKFSTITVEDIKDKKFFKSIKNPLVENADKLPKSTK